MDSIKKELGPSMFDTFMSVNGDVTLMFAIDDTGSMREEIQAAKDIAKSIVHHDRDETVDYILSPFNDPGKRIRICNVVKYVSVHPWAKQACRKIGLEGLEEGVLVIF